tara:strand:- start:12255 stop:12866 length:612 start_codon:yes stop_codon:yes gene_type:complete
MGVVNGPTPQKSLPIAFSIIRKSCEKGRPSTGGVAVITKPRSFDILPCATMGMDGHTRTLLTHYGIDATSLEVTPKVLKQIKADLARYEASQTDTTTSSRTKVTKYTQIKSKGAIKTTTGQSNLSGRSHGRSTGPVKKSGANKRSGGGREHGECIGASSRTSTKQFQHHTIKQVPSNTVTTHNKDKQIKSILGAYKALLELVG